MKTQSWVHRGGVGALLAVAVAALGGCSSGGSDEAPVGSGAAVIRSYVGTVEGTSAFVAVVVDGSRALAYVCDGVPAEPLGTTPTVQAWFNGASDGSRVDVQQAGGQLELQLTESGMSGSVILADGRAASVTGRLATGDAGLYRAEASGDDGTAVAGWILAADGQQRGGFGGEGANVPRVSGTRVLNLGQPTFSPQGLARARIERVGITPIPIP